MKCTGDPYPCSKCNDSAYLYYGNMTCDTTCPSPLVKNNVNRTCEDCSVYCVNMTLSRFIPSGAAGLAPLTFDLNFTYSLNWSTFVYPDFQSITFAGSTYSINDFNVTYSNLTSRMYRITINPYNYAFIINQSVTITVRARPEDESVLNYTSTD